MVQKSCHKGSDQNNPNSHLRVQLHQNKFYGRHHRTSLLVAHMALRQGLPKQWNLYKTHILIETTAWVSVVMPNHLNSQKRLLTKQYSSTCYTSIQSKNCSYRRMTPRVQHSCYFMLRTPYKTIRTNEQKNT